MLWRLYVFATRMYLYAMYWLIQLLSVYSFVQLLVVAPNYLDLIDKLERTKTSFNVNYLSFLSKPFPYSGFQKAVYNLTTLQFTMPFNNNVCLFYFFRDWLINFDDSTAHLNYVNYEVNQFQTDLEANEKHKFISSLTWHA